jgi:hypothetical protein
MAFSCLKKEIIYRGGVVRFFIPKHWSEEYEEDGGGIFYEPGDETGTLRLNVLSFLTKGDVSTRYLFEIVQKRMVENSGQIEVLPNDRFLLKYSFRKSENGEDLVFFIGKLQKLSLLGTIILQYLALQLQPCNRS